MTSRPCGQPPFPQNARQVRQSVVHQHPAIGAVMFGFELGTGARPFMTGAAPYVAITAAVMTTWWAPLSGVLAGVGFGLGRGLVPLERRLHHGDDRWDAWVQRHGARALPLASTFATTALAVVVLVA
jgi:hypothetical protein